MPKRAKIDDEIGGNRVLDDEQQAAANSEGAKLQNYLNRMASLQADIDEIMDNAKEACAPIRDDMKELKKEAAEAGFEKAIFACHVAYDRSIAKAKRAGRKLSEKQRETYDQQRHSLGQLADLPLGNAALSKHPDHQNGAAAH